MPDDARGAGGSAKRCAFLIYSSQGEDVKGSAGVAGFDAQIGIVIFARRPAQLLKPDPLSERICFFENWRQYREISAVRFGKPHLLRGVAGHGDEELRGGAAFSGQCAHVGGGDIRAREMHAVCADGQSYVGAMVDQQSRRTFSADDMQDFASERLKLADRGDLSRGVECSRRPQRRLREPCGEAVSGARLHFRRTEFDP